MLAKSEVRIIRRSDLENNFQVAPPTRGRAAVYRYDGLYRVTKVVQKSVARATGEVMETWVTLEKADSYAVPPCREYCVRLWRQATTCGDTVGRQLFLDDAHDG